MDQPDPLQKQNVLTVVIKAPNAYRMTGWISLQHGRLASIDRRLQRFQRESVCTRYRLPGDVGIVDDMESTTLTMRTESAHNRRSSGSSTLPVFYTATVECIALVSLSHAKCESMSW